MNANAWAAIAQGASEIGGSLLQNTFNKNAQRRQFRHNQQMAEYAYAQDLQMWNRQSAYNKLMWDLQNQYNLPENQMQRLRDAGLNPNLIYGTGAAGGQAGSIQSAQMPKYQQVRAQYNFQPFRMPDILGLYTQLRQSNAQVDNVEANTALTEEKRLTEAVNRSLTAARRSRVLAENPYYHELSKYSTELAKLQVDAQRQRLINQSIDQNIKQHMVGRTGAEAGLKQMEYQFFKNLGIKGMRDVSPFLQLLLQSYRR